MKAMGAIFCEAMRSPLSAISALFGLAALFFAWFIPRRIMVNQMYADFVKEYRSPEMGAAIHAVFQFYVEGCQNDHTRIPKEYENRYKQEKSLEPSKMLHFQRRLVAQFYYDLARLRYEFRCPRLSKKELRGWFTGNEIKLLSIILLMAEPARTVFLEAQNVPAPPDDEAPMNQLIKRLYEEAEDMV